MSAQEQDGAVPSAEAFHEQLEKLIIGTDALDCDAIDLIRERDAAIRRAAIEELGYPDSPTWPYVLAFARAMEEKLEQNRHKGDRDGWLTDPAGGLLMRLRQETDELEAEMFRLMTERDPEKVLKEAADVGNFAMFIADWYGALAVSSRLSDEGGGVDQ